MPTIDPTPARPASPGTTSPDRSSSVGILAFDGMEVLDFAGPYEAFSVAAELAPAAIADVRAVGVTDGSVTTRGGLSVVPPTTVATAYRPDVLVIPGGPGSRALLDEPEVLAWVASAVEGARLVLSVCTGALLLAAVGVLDGRQAATHHGARDELRALSPTTTVVDGRRYVQSSDLVWTSAGVSAGIDLALHVVQQLAGTAIHDAVVAEMEWGW